MMKHGELELANAIIECRKNLGQCSDDLNGSKDLEVVARNVTWAIKRLQIFLDAFVLREERMADFPEDILGEG